MNTYRVGDIVLASLLFTTQVGVKARPVLVIHDTGDSDLIVAPVTSHSVRSTEDILLGDWREAGLRLPSVARLGKVATIEKNTVIRLLGRVTASDKNLLKGGLQQMMDGILRNW